MAIYLLVFFITTLLFKGFRGLNRKQQLFFDILAIIILCSLAGARSANVGTDTNVYLQPSIYAAINSSNFKEFLKFNWLINGYVLKVIAQYEIGYVILIWISTKVFNSIFITQFIVELFIIIPIYFVLKKSHKKVWLGMLIFELLIFNSTLNMIRQSIACSFTVLTLYYWINKKRIYSLFYLLVAFSFHKSSLLIILIMGIYEFLNSSKNIKVVINNQKQIGNNKRRRMIILFILGILMLLLLNVIIKILEILGLGNYIYYISGGTNLSISINQIIYRLPALLFLYFLTRKLVIKPKNYYFYMLMILYTILANQLYGDTGATLYAGRIYQYFAIYQVFAFSEIYENVNVSPTFFMLLISYYFIYWCFYYAYLGIDTTIPYTTLSLINQFV